MCHHHEQVAQPIGQDVPVTSSDFLVAVVPSRAAAFGRFGTLAVHEAAPGMRETSLSVSFKLHQRPAQPFPRSIDAPLPKMVVHALARRVLVGQVHPLTIGVQRIEDGVEDSAQRMLYRLSDLSASIR
jgi:hypothetical protein